MVSDCHQQRAECKGVGKTWGKVASRMGAGVDGRTANSATVGLTSLTPAHGQLTVLFYLLSNFHDAHFPDVNLSSSLIDRTFQFVYSNGAPLDSVRQAFKKLFRTFNLRRRVVRLNQ
jgi:hypothetical protein